MAKVVKELVTKWTYKVDAKQLEKATKNIIKLKSKLLEVRKSSVTFGKQERNQLRTVGKGWNRATKQVDRYTRAKIKASRAEGGFFGGRRGKRGSFFGGGASGRLATLASTLGGGAAGGLLIGGGGVAGAGALGLLATLGLAGKKEQAKASIGGLLRGSGTEAEGGAKADKMLNSLNDFAKKTPFQINQLRELTSVLLAGGFAADEIVDSLRVMGDVTRGDNDKLNRMLFNFVQVKTVGKASAIDLRQFAMAGIPIFSTLRKQLGKTGEQLADMTRKGKITFQIIKDAFSIMTSKGGMFFMGMEIQSRTLFGILSNIKDAITVIGEAIGDEFLPAAKDMAQAFREWADEGKIPIVGRVKNIIKNFEMFSKIMKNVDGEFTALKTTIIAFGVALTGAFVVANPILSGTLLLLAAIGDVMNGLRGNKSFTLDVINANKKGGTSAVAAMMFKAGGNALMDTGLFKTTDPKELDTIARINSVMGNLSVKALAAKAQRDAATSSFLMGRLGVALATPEAIPGPSQSSNTTINANVNQSNHIQGGDFARDDMMNHSQDLMNLLKEEMRAKAAN